MTNSKKNKQLKKEANILESFINVILPKKETHNTLVQFLHVACFSPVVTTLLKALSNNQFTTWQGLATKLLRKYLKKIL